MSHRNARTTVHGRLLIVQRHRRGLAAGPHRQGDGDLAASASQTWVAVRRRGRGRAARPVLAAAHDADPDTSARSRAGSCSSADRSAAGRTGSAPSSGVPARTVSRILRRHGVPHLCELRPDDRRGDPGLEDHRGPLRTRPARRAGPHGRQEDRPDPRRRRLAGPRPRQRTTGRETQARIGYDYVHSLVDDHSRLAYSEILPDEKGATCAAFLTRAAATSPTTASPGSSGVMTDNAWAYRYVHCREAVRRARHQPEVHQAPLPLAERQGRTLQPHPADRMGLPAGLHQQRPNAPPPLRPGSSTTTLNDATPPSEDYPPISRLSPT